MNLRRCVWLPAIVLLVTLLTACSRRTPPPSPPPPAPPPVATAPAPPPPPPVQPPPAQPPAQVAQRPLTEDELFARKTLDQLNAEAPLADITFDYDQFAIRDDQRAILQRNADFLRRWPSVRVSIEGHADLRGTAHNLALGERRANSARDYLSGLGIAADRQAVVSKGEETPLCTDDTDPCHARNRRVHFVITGK